MNRNVPTLNQKVDDNGVKSQGVGGCAGVVTRVFGFDGPQHYCPIGHNETLPVLRHWDGCVLTNSGEEGRFIRKLS